MTPPLATRIHLLITGVLVMGAVSGGAVLGLLLGGRLMAVVTAGAAGLGAGAGSFLARRQVVGLFSPVQEAASVGGYAEGLADAVLVGIATYRAAVFPLTPDGVTEEERTVRRTVAYRISAYEGLPHPVQVSAAAALEAIDQGLDAQRAEAAMKALCITVYEHRGGR
ncbi:hypothetical protein ACFWUQ_06480 [Streptomyces sp. NPDC058662]|uniref:hypothetical protein n=1 Tax=Streptomyces sp. NPDC058662 TaxID=3346583 RepID=UPI003665619C